MVVLFKYKTDDNYYEIVNSIIDYLKEHYDFYSFLKYHYRKGKDLYHLGSFDMYGITYFIKIEDKRQCGMYNIARVILYNEHHRTSQKVLKEIKKIIKEVQQ